MDNDMEDVDKHYEWLHSEYSSAAGDIFGEPQKTARIGDEYQAQIPNLMTENKHLQLNELPTSQDANIDVQNKFRVGLWIPVFWIQNPRKKKEAAKGKSGLLVSRTDNLVPGSSCESWSRIEHDSFLLGLYIFGKNLRLVNKFVGNKGMRNVLSYYYGKFYRSSEHKKWSRYRKKRSRKSVPGKKIFNGWRRQELLSRLLPNVTDECKTSLTQVTRMFEEQKLLFEKYVLTLRDTVGINLLVEAVAIGKGKRDLTSRAKKPTKNKKLHSACSSLETEEILKLLKDCIGLSKERLNEIFWNAVWPRLLATGWHSEQPRNYALQNSKNSLVFLAPGVTKFSRRSLEKGSQYFDSFNEVLNKVASEPWLLEDQNRLVEPQGYDDKQDLMKCTIVDTSLVGVVKVRELTSLPVPKPEPAVIQSSCSVSGETEQDTTEESQNEDVDHNTAEFDSLNCEARDVNHLDDKKIDLATNEKPVRKLKLICKSKAKRQQHANTSNDNLSGEDDAMEDPRSKKRRRGIVIDLNHPRVGPGSDGDNSSSVLHETTTNQPEFSGAGQRQSTRNRPLSTKALEALANGFLNPKKKKRGSEDGTRRRVRAKTALVSSCGARYIENRVDGVFNGTSRMVRSSPK